MFMIEHIVSISRNIIESKKHLSELLIQTRFVFIIPHNSSERMKRSSSITKNGVFLTAMITVVLTLTVPVTAAAGVSNRKLIVVTNNHTNYLTVRCFSFNNGVELPQHLKTKQKYKFWVDVRPLYPSASMFNCSTNMGTFVAFKHDYLCSKHVSNTCFWRFDETMSYLYNPIADTWKAVEYNPNYESLHRGGVITGYYVN